jgi:hypothetical protein
MKYPTVQWWILLQLPVISVSAAGIDNEHGRIFEAHAFIS